MPVRKSARIDHTHAGKGKNRKKVIVVPGYCGTSMLKFLPIYSLGKKNREVTHFHASCWCSEETKKEKKSSNRKIAWINKEIFS